jgi:hypothetical protein
MCVIPVVEQASDVCNREAASLKIDIRHQDPNERHQPRAGRRLDLQKILRRQVQHRYDPADLSSVRSLSLQADQLPVIELPRLHRPLIRLHRGNQQRAAYRLGAGSVDQLGKPHQQPAGVITNRPHRETPGTAFVTEYLTESESALRLIGAEFHGNLATYAMRPLNHTNNYFYGSLRSLRIAL